MAPKKLRQLKLREALSIMQAIGVVKGQQRVYDERSGGLIKDAWFPDERPNAGAKNLKEADKWRVQSPYDNPGHSHPSQAPYDQNRYPKSQITPGLPNAPKSRNPKLIEALERYMPMMEYNMPGTPYEPFDGSNGQHPQEVPTIRSKPKKGESEGRYRRRLRVQRAT